MNLKEMNLPNKLTLFRVVLIPFFVLFLLINPDNQAFRIIADLIFIVASLTDMLDGKIARKYNLVTNFGKFMDPLADKLLVCSAMICLIQTKQLAAWFVIIIVAREFIISGFRLIAAENGVVIAANIFGKLKTVSQMIMIIILVANLPFGWLQILGQLLIWVSLILTVLSLVIYIYQNSDVLKEQN
ncbi:CDP-diacylglycerol--glycerol-3-phosphate 3-phosphatidyltransferase [Pseudobutyrivibrio sp. OR37]|nr:CDP-diacylglycerol--glycerol-3-phosphate 3-phosphatidyltransferase [Pseudobutyrivibrio sp. OR37]SFI02430.1 CDP-diacylglycerol--glycerol-3-phosphate 3-phosphatidyltransferase [Pseudobutyrivibrio sp. OR37]